MSRLGAWERRLAREFVAKESSLVPSEAIIVLTGTVALRLAMGDAAQDAAFLGAQSALAWCAGRAASFGTYLWWVHR